MTNNDLLRRIRFALNVPDPQVLALMATGGVTVTREQLEPWFLKDEDPGYIACPGTALNAFLDGLILAYRGPRSDGEGPPDTAVRINNNLILKKLRIALNLQEADCLALLAKEGLSISKNELSALFRKPGTKNFQACGDQLLRNFITGLAALPKPGLPR